MSGEDVHLCFNATGKAILTNVLVSQNGYEDTPSFTMYDVKAPTSSTGGVL